jgi:hypothetical protein
MIALRKTSLPLTSTLSSRPVLQPNKVGIVDRAAHKVLPPLTHKRTYHRWPTNTAPSPVGNRQTSQQIHQFLHLVGEQSVLCCSGLPNQRRRKGPLAESTAAAPWASNQQTLRSLQAFRVECWMRSKTPTTNTTTYITQPCA